MCEEKKVKIFLIPARPVLFIMIAAGGKAENAVYSSAMNKFSNEKQGDFNFFYLCNRFFKGFFKI